MAKVFPVPGGTYQNDWGAPRSGGRGHEGTDIFAKMGAPVVAVADGKITAAGDDGGKGGLRLWISGTYYYAHLSGLAKGIKVGTKVKAGQVIGYVGTSGNAKGTPPHLHFGIDPKGGHSSGDSWTNPYPILTKLEAGEPVEYDENDAPVLEETTAVGADQSAIDAEYNRAQGMNYAIGSISTPQQGQPSPVAGYGFPGETQPALAPKPAPLETWRALSVLPGASPDTMRYLQMAELGYGDDAA